MGDQVSVEAGLLSALGADFTGAGERLSGISNHDSADIIATGLPGTDAAQACTAAGAAAGAALQSLAGHYQTMSETAHTNAANYERTDADNAAAQRKIDGDA